MTSLLVRQIEFNQSFALSIEEKQIEEQKRLRAETEAVRVQTEARGRADAGRRRSSRSRQCPLIEAQAEAEALRVISDQIAANPNLIQYLYVANLSDNVTFALLPSDSPFIFNVDDFANLGADFQAPEATVRLTEAGG